MGGGYTREIEYVKTASTAEVKKYSRRSSSKAMSMRGVSSSERHRAIELVLRRGIQEVEVARVSRNYVTPGAVPRE